MTSESLNTTPPPLDGDTPEAGKADAGPRQQRQRVLRIRITEVETGQHKVGMTFPVNLVSVALRQGARFVPSNLLDFDLVRAIERGELHSPLILHDERNGERVEISVE